MPGPPPKRSDQRRRRNTPDTPVERVELEGVVEPIPAKKGWHPVARQWYEALASSGQAVHYEPSDWATAYLLAESLSRELRPQVLGIDKEGNVVKAALPIKGTSLAAYLKGMTSLMVTEGDRRRARLELQRAGAAVEEAPPDVSDFAEYRARRAR